MKIYAQLPSLIRFSCKHWSYQQTACLLCSEKQQPTMTMSGNVKLYRQSMFNWNAVEVPDSSIGATITQWLEHTQSIVLQSISIPSQTFFSSHSADWCQKTLIREQKNIWSQNLYNWDSIFVWGFCWQHDNVDTTKYSSNVILSS